ncbi:MAG: GTPase ObgE [Magnetococcales bacterium]|nr:GTPase ObgE [Magnetococcales bacterium]NGZ27833.1 GTPase ObgE [Magnetococcales bacterium]
MRFLDEVKIYVSSGAGGDGCVAFRREKYVPEGGPSGGDGGNGGDVIFVTDTSLNTLIDFRYRQHWRAPRGGNGMGKDRNGRYGEHLVVRVPLGTVIRNDADGRVLFDLTQPGRVVVAQGGRGGRGNRHFKSSTHQTPREAEPGQPGEEFWLRLELKLLADVGLVGMPNAGKSSLIARVSAAKAKIADYPFTTLVPNLGMVRVDHETSFVIADIPGLIPGASKGAGLGHTFLRHVERCALLVHLVEPLPSDESKPAKNFQAIEKELRAYAPSLAAKPRLVVLSKGDLLDEEGQKELLKKLKKKANAPVHLISAATGLGLEELIHQLAEKVNHIRREEGEKARRALADAPIRRRSPNNKEEDDDWQEDDYDVETIWVP